MKIMVTGGAGFIGSALIRHLINNTEDSVINVDKLTYAGNLKSLEEISRSPRYTFYQTDIANQKEVAEILERHQPDYIMHLAAESHVDRSINGPSAFIETNIVGTYKLLEASLGYFNSLPDRRKQSFRFHHISTDEVFGDLGDSGFFTEDTPYQPSSPYSASKASSDHLVRAWHRTYKLPTIITNCSNNYGPFQFPEKLIPLTIKNAQKGKIIPVYGDGSQIRDWLYVEDHVTALYKAVAEGDIGETYNIGGNNECKNIDLIYTICDTLQRLAPDTPRGITHYKELIQFVEDRPGHDHRYAIDATKIQRELAWHPKESLETGLEKTIKWYLSHPD